jgi:hypothetical protein
MICNNVMTYNQPDTVHKAAKRLLHIPAYNLWPCSDGQISAPVPTISNYGELILKLHFLTAILYFLGAFPGKVQPDSVTSQWIDSNNEWKELPKC